MKDGLFSLMDTQKEFVKTADTGTRSTQIMYKNVAKVEVTTTLILNGYVTLPTADVMIKETTKEIQ